MHGIERADRAQRRGTARMRADPGEKRAPAQCGQKTGRAPEHRQDIDDWYGGPVGEPLQRRHQVRVHVTSVPLRQRFQTHLAKDPGSLYIPRAKRL